MRLFPGNVRLVFDDYKIRRIVFEHHLYKPGGVLAVMIPLSQNELEALTGDTDKMNMSWMITLQNVVKLSMNTFEEPDDL